MFPSHDPGVKGSASPADAASRGQLEGAISGLGAGAGAGAAIGTVVPVIGTALGAAIGGASGAIGGAIIGAINAPLQQASFTAAKKLQTSGKNIAVALDKVAKDITSQNVSNLARTLDQSTVDFTNGVKTFQKQFDNGITASGVAINAAFGILTGGITQQIDRDWETF